MTIFLVKRVCAAALLCALAASAGAALKLSDPVPIGPQVKVGKLANGLTYYIQKNGKPEKKLELRLVVKAGSILEDEDQQGLAHFTEHLAFNGSTNFKKHELVSYLQSIGVKMGADLNAYTSFDETVYILPIPTEKRENVEKGFLVLEDWAHGLTLDKDDIDKERGIVMEELRLGKGAQDRMNKVLYPKIFNGSRYAQRLPIGKEEVIKNAKYEAVRRFYKDWYRPDLMAVVVVGDIELADAEKLIHKHFDKLKNPATPRLRTYAPIPARAVTEAAIVTDKEAQGNAVLIRYPVMEIKEKGTFGSYREKLLELLFTAMLNQRLQELAQLPEPPFLGGGSAVGRLTARYKSFSSSAGLGKGGPVPAINALVQENARARQYGFSAGEFDRAKKNVARLYERAYIERDKTDSSNYVGEYVRNFLEKESIPGIENEYKYLNEFLPAITLEEINRYAHDTIPGNSAKLVVYMGNSNPETPAPSAPALLASVTAAEKVVVKARTEQDVAKQLMDKPPAGGTIVEETRDAKLGLTRLTLSNGVKVVLKPTDFNNDQIVMSAAREGGQTLFDDKDAFNARYASSVASVMGLSTYSPLDLQKILAGKSASVGVGLADYTDSVSGNAGVKDVETMLQFVYLKFTGARRDEGLYKSFMGKQLEGARTALVRPEAVFNDTVISTLYNNHPRVARTTRPEDLAKVNLDRALEIYRTRFSSAKGMTFFLVGSIDPVVVKPLLATYLGSLPTGDIPVAFRDVGIRPVTGVVKKEVRSGSEAKSIVSLSFTGKAEFSEMEDMRLRAMIDVMNLRIHDILREKMSLIYGGGMYGNLARVPYGHYTIGTQLPTGPDNVDKVIAATFAEITRMKEQGPDAADLNKVKQNWLQLYQKGMRENGFWLGYMQGALLNGTDPANILEYEKMVAQVSAADLKSAAQRYFDTANYVQVVLQPEKK